MHGGRGGVYTDNTDMEYIKTTKLIKNGTSLAIVIPKEILTALHLGRGDQFFVGIIDHRTIGIKKVTQEDLLNFSNASAGATAIK